MTQIHNSLLGSFRTQTVCLLRHFFPPKKCERVCPRTFRCFYPLYIKKNFSSFVSVILQNRHSEDGLQLNTNSIFIYIAIKKKRRTYSAIVKMCAEKCCFCFEQKMGVRTLGIVMVILSAFAVVAGVIVVSQVSIIDFRNNLNQNEN